MHDCCAGSSVPFLLCSKRTPQPGQRSAQFGVRYAGNRNGLRRRLHRRPHSRRRGNAALIQGDTNDCFPPEKQIYAVPDRRRLVLDIGCPGGRNPQVQHAADKPQGPRPGGDFDADHAFPTQQQAGLRKAVLSRRRRQSAFQRRPDSHKPAQPLPGPVSSGHRPSMPEAQKTATKENRQRQSI